MSAAACAEVDPERWDETLSAAGVTDVYYTRGYVAASAALVDAEPVLLRLAGDGGEVLFACLLRRDPTDVVTPYGYGGPVGAGESPPLAAFPAAYESWCERRGVVSSFAVFHPLLANAASPASEGFRRIELAGTVAWPLGREDLLAPMHKHHRRVVRRAQAEEYEVAVEPAPADLAEFAGVYEQTMRRAGAAPFYFFPQSYWDALLAGVKLVRVDVRDAGRAARERARDGRAAVAALPPGRRHGRRARYRRQPSRALQPRLLGARPGLRHAPPRRRCRRP